MANFVKQIVVTKGVISSPPVVDTVSSADMTATGVTAAAYTNTSLTVDAAGRITAASNGTGGVSSVTASSPLASSGGSTPNITLASNVPTSKGGTGLDSSAAANGSLLIGTGSGLALATLTAGSGVTVTNSSGGITLSATGTGGTVTSVDVSGANGIGVSGSPITTSGTIALSLGAITPTSVNASGTVLGSNLSGTNTGDQTITLTSDVTGSGTGSFATTIASNAVTTTKINNSAVTYAKLQNETASTLLGNPTVSGAAPSEITLGTGLSFSGTTLVGHAGTVTSVAVSGANGIGVSGSPITTSGTIALSLGAITPTSVNASGTVVGSNLSGTNTGDQTITLTGDVTGSGTGSFAATIASNAVTTAKINNSAVTLAKIVNTSASRLLGNPSGSGAAPSEISIGSGLTFSGTTLNASLGVASGSTVPVSPTLGDLFWHNPTGRKVLLQYDGSNWKPLKNYGQSTVYVSNTSGADSVNKGFGTGTDAYQTIQYAINSVASICESTVQINIAPNGSHYDENIVIANKTVLDGGQFILEGGATSVSILESNTCSSTGNAQGNSALIQGACSKASGNFTSNYAGDFIKFTSGTCNGFWGVVDSTPTGAAICNIVSNNLGAVPANTNAYDIFVLTTAISASSGTTITIGEGQKNVVLQHLSIDTGGSYGVQILGRASCSMYYCAISSPVYGVYLSDAASSLTLNTCSLTAGAASAACLVISTGPGNYCTVTSTRISGQNRATPIAIYLNGPSVCTFTGYNAIINKPSGSFASTGVYCLSGGIMQLAYCSIKGWTLGVTAQYGGTVSNSTSGVYVTESGFNTTYKSADAATYSSIS